MPQAHRRGYFALLKVEFYLDVPFQISRDLRSRVVEVLNLSTLSCPAHRAVYSAGLWLKGGPLYRFVYLSNMFVLSYLRTWNVMWPCSCSLDPSVRPDTLRVEFLLTPCARAGRSFFVLTTPLRLRLGAGPRAYCGGNKNASGGLDFDLIAKFKCAGRGCPRSHHSPSRSPPSLPQPPQLPGSLKLKLSAN
ncbi:hypothetical protein B0H14DRAFT_2556588 [Mycena olivaceomarginata]|nr:hypothetical protein B0H14DRAFT_2556588 [Mycena olivaceomarginata]